MGGVIVVLYSQIMHVICDSQGVSKSISSKISSILDNRSTKCKNQNS